MYAPLVKQKGKIFFLKVLSSLLVDLWSSHCPTCCTTKHWHSCSRTFSRWSNGTVCRQLAGVYRGKDSYLLAIPSCSQPRGLVTSGSCHRTTKSQNHKITESFRLKKVSKITKSNLCPISSLSPRA